MNFIKQIFGQENELTQKQFYFPYFFDELDFRRRISPFNLTTEVNFNEKTKMASELDLISEKTTKLTIKFGERLMIKDENLMIWSTDKDSLVIKKFNLEIHSKPEVIKIEIPKLELGINKFQNNLGLTNFVTYIRS